MRMPKSPMNKAALSFVVAFGFACAMPNRVVAQQKRSEADLLKQLDTIKATGSSTPTAPATSPTAPKSTDAKQKAKPDEQPEQKGPTEITATEETTYDEKTRKAIFKGNVVVKDPQFTITCAKLTAFLKPAGESGNSGSAKNPTGGDSGSGGGGGGLDHAIADGTHENPVIIVQDKPATDGGQPQHNVGRAERAEYNATTGEVKLSGWPQVSQGINLQKATSADTVMYMNRDAKTMRTVGPSTTIIQEQDKSDGKTSQRQ